MQIQRYFRVKGRSGIVFWILFGALLQSPVCAETIFSTACRYDMAYDDGSPKSRGNEFTIPFGLAYTSRHFSLSLETAYGNAYVKTDDGADSGLAGLTDMLLSASYVYIFPNRPLGLMAGIDMNIPTGREKLTTEEIGAEWGQSNDLFEVDNFGAGLNVGLSLGLMQQFHKNVMGALQGAYLFNGAFDPTKEIEDDTLNPGDQLLLLGLLNWQTTSWLKMNLVLSYSFFGADSTAGEAQFRQGDRFALSSNIRMSRGPVEVFTGIQSTFSRKNEILKKEGLQKEPKNSNGTSVFALTALTYTFSPALSVRLQGDIRYYGESQLLDEQSELPFSGERIRYAVGPGWNYRLTPRLSSHGLLKVFFMNQAQDTFVDSDITYKGMNLDIGFTYVL